MHLVAPLVMPRYEQASLQVGDPAIYPRAVGRGLDGKPRALGRANLDSFTCTWSLKQVKIYRYLFLQVDVPANWG